MVFGGIPGWPLWGRERLVTIEPFSSPVISLTDAIAEGKTLRLDSQEKITSWVRFELVGI